MTLPEAPDVSPARTSDSTAVPAALLSPDEAHDLLRLLQMVAAEGDELAEEAAWFAGLLADRLPPEVSAPAPDFPTQ
ncbi:hypothetical protein [Streptomyces sp. NPDC058657]|uniref:hypothetical protein n=1 Tax=unclassified Streptomyces TaxID=2593676 RepID=UPI00365E0991